LAEVLRRLSESVRGVNWRTGAGTTNVRAFLKAVQAELSETNASVLDEWIGNQTTAEILGVTEVFVSLLAKAGQLDRNGPTPISRSTAAGSKLSPRNTFSCRKSSSGRGSHGPAMSVGGWQSAASVSDSSCRRTAT
jgi:hypothetical protein